jgi:hypothetical protein
MQIVNGYVCRNCTDALRAHKGIDPAHPQDGPYGRERDPHDPSRPPALVSLATSGDVGTRLHVVA